MNEQDFEDSYVCACGEAISQVRVDSMPKLNNLWVEKILQFLKEHKEHGFKL